MGDEPGPVPLRSEALRRDLRFSSTDAAAFSLMVGAGETYIPAFALALGASDVVAGLVSSAPLLTGAILQLVSPLAVLRLGSHRRWVVLCARAQAASFAPLILGAALGVLPLVGLFGAVSLYWAAGMATGPTWNTWMETLIPARMRARYLARRAGLAQLSLLAGMMVGALVLSLGERRGQLLPAFALLFVGAALCRGVSSVFLSRQSEPEPIPAGYRNVALREFAGVGRRTDAHLLTYLLCLQISVYVAAPFFTPYMLGPLGLSYTGFMALVGASFAAKALILPRLGNLAGRFGAHRLLIVASIGVAPLAALWTVSNSFAYLLGLQITAGIMWAAHELAVMLLFFETIPRAERTSMLTVFNLANAIAMLVGSACGAVLLSTFGESREGYAMIFGVSTAGRLACLILIRRIPALEFKLEMPVLRTLAVRPSLGGIDRPILASLTQGGRVHPPSSPDGDQPTPQKIEVEPRP